MPVNQFPRRALPARFRRPRVLIVGCGDVGQRIARDLQRPHGRGARVMALTSSVDRIAALHAQGIMALVGNLDEPASLRRLRGLAHRVVYMAPPPSTGVQDTRVRHLSQVLMRGRLPVQLVYGSTTGVYGNCHGAWVSENRSTAPATDRAHRRVDAEQHWQRWGRQRGVRVNVLRIPGIYAADREGGTPRTRLLKGLPVLLKQDDVFTNHIHADDLAQTAVVALWRGTAGRIYHACDDTELCMGDYFDLAADLYGLPRPARVSRAQAQQLLPPMMLSFMGESRRLRNDRLKRELRVRLRYPTVHEGLQARSENC